MRSHSVTRHLKLVKVSRQAITHYAIYMPPEGWKAELTLAVGYIPR